MLLPRFLTALFGIPLILLVIWMGYLPYFFFVYAVIFLGLYEFYFLWTERGYNLDKIFGYIFGTLLLMSFYLNSVGLANPAVNEGTGLIFTVAILAYLTVNLFKSSRSATNVGTDSEKTYINLVLTFWSIIYVVWLLGHLILLREIQPFGREYTYLIFFTTWFSDTVAYSVGTKFGQYQLAKKISPKKTWEGAIAGFLTSLLVALLFKIILLRQFSYLQALLIGIILGIGGQLGDLTESFLKRQVGVKDSSSLLPGHGGILDRFDSITFTAPLLYYYLRIFL